MASSQNNSSSRQWSSTRGGSPYMHSNSGNNNPAHSPSRSRPPNASMPMSDEEYARQLQAQYANEARPPRGAPASSRGPASPSGPPPAVAPEYVSPRSSTAAPTSPPSSRPPPPIASCTVVPIIRIHTSSTTSSSSSLDDDIAPDQGRSRSRAMVRDASVLADAAYAKKVQQELQDEEVARRMQMEEQRSNNNNRIVRGELVGSSTSNNGGARSSSNRATQSRAAPANVGAMVSQDGRRPRRSLCACISRCISCLICLAVAIVLGVVGYSYLSGKPIVIDVSDLGGNIGDVFMEDPWNHGPDRNSSAPETFWRTSGNDGLELTVLNALTEDWHTHFDAAIQDWDSGTPDALTLKTSVVAPDSTCEPVSGTIKVCNGEYGLTGWKGINEVLVTSRGYITVSVAKMNESYLPGTSVFGQITQSSSDAERRYTMCHEIGHGFGLNHADENFNNRDLGTCMDYTNRPQNNLTPNEENYQTLATLYGIVPGSSTSAIDISAQQARTIQDGSSVSETTKHASTGGDNRDRALRTGNGPFSLRGKSTESSAVTDEHHPRFTSFANETDENRRLLWRVLERQPGKELHIRELENGYRVVAHVLLATDNDDELQ